MWLASWLPGCLAGPVVRAEAQVGKATRRMAGYLASTYHRGLFAERALRRDVGFPGTGDRGAIGPPLPPLEPVERSDRG
jgi:hypothetical protein